MQWLVRGSFPPLSLLKLFCPHFGFPAFHLSFQASPLLPTYPSPVLAASLWACFSCSLQSFAFPLPVAPQPLGMSQLMGWWGSTIPANSSALGAVWLTCPIAVLSAPWWDRRCSAALKCRWEKGKGDWWCAPRHQSLLALWLPRGGTHRQRILPLKWCWYRGGAGWRGGEGCGEELSNLSISQE